MKHLLLASMFTPAVLTASGAAAALQGKICAYIPTAGIPEGLDPMDPAGPDRLRSMGIRVRMVDVAALSPQETAAALADCAAIAAAGGNTFFLLQELRRSGADALIRRRISEGCWYLGESAGAAVAAPDISYLAPMDEPSLAPALTSTAALGLVDFYPLPHMDNEWMGAAAREILSTGLPGLRPLRDDQALLVTDTDTTLITA